MRRGPSLHGRPIRPTRGRPQESPLRWTEPLADGFLRARRDAGAPLVEAGGGAEGAAEGLHGAFGFVVVVDAGEDANVHVEPGFVGHRLEEVLDKIAG